jgi:hypothetical protein
MRCSALLRGSVLAAVIAIAAMDASCQIQDGPGRNNSSEIMPQEAYSSLLNTSLDVSYLDSMISLSELDQATSMPENATVYRAKAQTGRSEEQEGDRS